MAEPARARSFGPVVLTGLAGAGLAAVAAAHDWARASGRAAGVSVTGVANGSDAAPPALALALVALAAWGVVLVLRGRPRRAAAAVGAVAAVGEVVVTLAASGRATADALRAAVARGAAADSVSSSLTGWYAAAAVGGLVAAGCLAVAVVAAGRWPAMGSRYDAPTARRAATESGDPATGATPRPVTGADMWRALDEGRDPTA